ncbi:MAG: hypothetical protein KIT83_20120 [Bryobacterales bacterium]|nr:hypothetical protein [Bryobacterales bacterium]
MKLQSINQSLTFLLILLGSCAGTCAVYAQSSQGEAIPVKTDQAPPAPSKPSASRELPLGITFGATVSVLPFSPLPDLSTQTTTSDPVSQTVTGSSSTSNPVGIGAYVEVPVYSRLALHTGFLLRSVSFNAGTETILGEDTASTTVDERTFTSSLQRTRARYWEVPLVLRLYDSADHRKRFRAFIEGGAAYRIATVTETYREFTDADGTVTSDRALASLANSNAFGALIGAGFRAKGSGRVAFVPGIRFTRWFAPTFLDGPTRSTKNQMELMLSVTF